MSENTIFEAIPFPRVWSSLINEYRRCPTSGSREYGFFFIVRAFSMCAFVVIAKKSFGKFIIMNCDWQQRLSNTRKKGNWWFDHFLISWSRSFALIAAVDDELLFPVDACMAYLPFNRKSNIRLLNCLSTSVQFCFNIETRSTQMERSWIEISLKLRSTMKLL